MTDKTETIPALVLEADKLASWLLTKDGVIIERISGTIQQALNYFFDMYGDDFPEHYKMYLYITMERREGMN